MNPHQLPQVMVATARQGALQEVLRTITDGIAQCPNTVLTRIWLAIPDRSCPLCREIEDQTDIKALHLAASAGVPHDKQADYSRVEEAFTGFRSANARSAVSP